METHKIKVLRDFRAVLHGTNRVMKYKTGQVVDIEHSVYQTFKKDAEKKKEGGKHVEPVFEDYIEPDDDKKDEQEKDKSFNKQANYKRTSLTPGEVKGFSKANPPRPKPEGPPTRGTSQDSQREPKKKT